MPTVGGVVFALFAWRRAAEAAPRVRRAGRPEALRACPGSSSDSTLRHHPPRRPTLRETKTGGWAHRPRPPPRVRSATRLAGHPPILARLQAEQTRGAAAPHDLFPAARRVARLKTTWAVPARHLQSRPAPATPPSEPFSTRLRGPLEPRFRDVLSFSWQPRSAPPCGRPQHHTCCERGRSGAAIFVRTRPPERQRNGGGAVPAH